MPKGMKRTPGGLLVTEDADAVPLKPNEIRIDWDADYVRGTVREVIRRADANGNELDPVVVSMMLADIIGLGARFTLESMDAVRQMTALRKPT